MHSFRAFSIAIDESTDISDVAQLAIFIRGVNDSLKIIEEFVELVPMTDTSTATDIFAALVKVLDGIGVDWSKAVSLVADGAPSMIGRKAGVAAKFKEKVNNSNSGNKFWSFHCIIHQEALCCKALKMDHVMEVVVETVNFIRSRSLNHRQFDSFLNERNVSFALPYYTEVRWLSRGTVLKRFFALRNEIRDFMEKKGKPNLKFLSENWLQDLAFMVDVTKHLNHLNTALQGETKIVTQYFECICAFKMKLRLWITQLSRGELSHFPCLKEISQNSCHSNFESYKTKLAHLLNEFEQRFTIFTELDKEFKIFTSPFTVEPLDVPIDLQLEIIDLQCNSSLKEKFFSNDLKKFYQYLSPNYPKLTSFAAKILSMFGTTYLCEQLFSIMSLKKNKIRSRLTNQHLNNILKVVSTQNLTPDVEEIIKNKRSQISGANS